MTIHLVRSIYERGLGAGRNSCEVCFDEDISIPLRGEKVDQREEEEAIDDNADVYQTFRLMSVVTHKGSHDSGHYICYRRRKRERKHLNVRKSLNDNVVERTEDIVDTEEGDRDDGVVALEHNGVGLGLEDESRTK
jgi:uncharacterized UBP type Zn finger protein